MKTKYTKEILEPIINNSESIAQVLNKLGLLYSGGSYAHIKKMIKHFNINTDHFLGQAINKGKPSESRKTPEKYLVVYPENISQVNTHEIKRRILRDKIKDHVCENCRNTTWNNLPIPLELHHKNGNRKDNRIENILLLCPNCHAQTDNYRGRATKKYIKEAGVV